MKNFIYIQSAMAIENNKIFQKNISLNYEKEVPFETTIEERIYKYQKQLYLVFFRNILKDVNKVTKSYIIRELEVILAKTLFYIKAESRGSPRFIHKISYYDTDINFETLLKNVIKYHDTLQNQIIELKKAEY